MSPDSSVQAIRRTEPELDSEPKRHRVLGWAGPYPKCSPVIAGQPFIEFFDDRIGIAVELWPQEPHRQLVASSSSSYTNGMREPSRHKS